MIFSSCIKEIASPTLKYNVVFLGGPSLRYLLLNAISTILNVTTKKILTIQSLSSWQSGYWVVGYWWPVAFLSCSQHLLLRGDEGGNIHSIGSLHSPLCIPCRSWDIWKGSNVSGIINTNQISNLPPYSFRVLIQFCCYSFLNNDFTPWISTFCVNLNKL